MLVNDINCNRFLFEVSVDRATCASLWGKLRGSQRLIEQRLPRAVSAEVEFDIESQSYSVLRIGNHRLPVSLTVRPGTGTHSSMSRLLASSLRQASLKRSATRTESTQQLITLLEKIIGSAEDIQVQTVQLMRTDFEVGKVGAFSEPSKIARPRHITRLSPSISLSLDDEPQVTLPILPPSEVERLVQHLRATVHLLEAPEVRVTGNHVEIQGILIAREQEVRSVELYLHWGRYDSHGVPWRDERIHLTPRGSGLFAFKHRLQVLEKGNYGAALYVQPANVATAAWLDQSKKDDLRFDIRESDTRRFRAQEVAIERAERRALEELRATLGSREELLTAVSNIRTKNPFLGVGKLLSDLCKDPANKERFLDTCHAALDSDDVDEVKSLINTYGIGEIVFIAPEGPHAGAGGLAQVISGLVPELDRNQIPTTVIAPLYEESNGNKHASAKETIRRGIRFGNRTVKPVPVGEITVHVGPTFFGDSSTLKRWPATIPLQVLCAEFGSTRLFLLRNLSIFDRLYRPVLADELLRRAAILSRGALETIATARFGIRPSIIISNDWMTAFVPALLATDGRYRALPWMDSTRTVHMVHNGGADYHGKVPCRFHGEDLWPMLGIAPEHIFGFRDPVHHDLLNPTAAAAHHATGGILTVSEPYAHQLTSPWGGDGLDMVLSQRASTVFGISNGISRRDLDAFFERIAPAPGASSCATENLLERKSWVKTRLQDRYALTIDSNATLISFVGRFAEQKGLSLLSSGTAGDPRSVVESILAHDPQVQFLFAGPETQGDVAARELVQVLMNLRQRYPGRISVTTDYISHPAALEIMFGSTLFLMPSRFEPGGIAQLEALAAGALVVGRNVGGISATVENFDPIHGTGNGFLCNDYSPIAFRNTLLWALDVIARPELYRRLVASARSARHDWGDRIPLYRSLFRRLLLSSNEQLELVTEG